MAYKLNPSDGEHIDTEKAKNWISKYEKKHPGEIKAYFFGSEIIKKILDHPEAAGMRIYLSYNDQDKMHMVLVGTREDGANIWPVALNDGSGTAADTGVPCPPYC